LKISKVVSNLVRASRILALKAQMRGGERPNAGPETAHHGVVSSWKIPIIDGGSLPEDYELL